VRAEFYANSAVRAHQRQLYLFIENQVFHFARVDAFSAADAPGFYKPGAAAFFRDHRLRGADVSACGMGAAAADIGRIFSGYSSGSPDFKSAARYRMRAVIDSGACYHAAVAQNTFTHCWGG